MSMNVIFTLLLAAAVIFMLHRRFFGFGAQRPEDYANAGPPMDIRAHLGGPIISEGVIYGPTGRVASRFVARIQGDWTGSGGTLSESFTYANGARQDRKWVLTMGENGAFTATADDIIGTATGQQSGASMCMRYRIRLPKDAGGHVLNVTDWLYLVENGTIINRSEMRKFGIKVAELIATMRPARP